MLKYVASALLAMSAIAPASAGIITGPALPYADSGWANVGMQFTAHTNSTLSSFYFNSQGHADTVVLSDGSGVILQSVATSGGLLNVNWALSAGQSYLLLQTGANNAMFASDNGSAVRSNADMTITDSGVFGCNGAIYSNCTFKGQDYWSAFTQLNTNAPLGSVPEPGSLALLGLAIAGVAAARRRKLG